MKLSLVIVSHKFSTNFWFGTEINSAYLFLRNAYGVNMSFITLQPWALQNEVGNGLYLNLKRAHDEMILTIELTVFYVT